MKNLLRVLLITSAVVFAAACGGGGGGGGSTSTPTGSGIVVNPLSITTSSGLPATINGRTYSATLQATGGTAPYHWKAEASPNGGALTGLTLDANSGVLSGTANFTGIGASLVTVTDSATPPQTNFKTFFITSGQPLTLPASQSLQMPLFSDAQFLFFNLGAQGGVPPFTYALSGTLPPGLHLNSPNPNFSGSPFQQGTFQSQITITDSVSPPEVLTQSVTIKVNPAQLIIANSLPPTMPLNVLFSGPVVAVGGTPPYTFSFTSPFPVPAGATIDPPTGRLDWTPTLAGNSTFFFTVHDSAVPPVTAAATLFVNVITTALSRNDAPATATRIGNAGAFAVSLSPYIDPPSVPGSSYPADHDWYKFVAVPGTVVHFETNAKRINSANPIDTVIQVTDMSGAPLIASCRQPGDTSNNFTSPCLNDDISSSPHVQDSALDFQVSASAPQPATYLVHVFDWSGRARPDMTYNLSATNVVEPLTIQNTPLPQGFQGQPYNFQLGFNGGANGGRTWNSAGTLPPGLNVSTAGVISGIPTTPGPYPFSITVTDTANQTTTANVQIVIN